jgi:hypothetical protein
MGGQMAKMSDYRYRACTSGHLTIGQLDAAAKAHAARLTSITR